MRKAGARPGLLGARGQGHKWDPARRRHDKIGAVPKVREAIKLIEAEAGGK